MRSVECPLDYSKFSFNDTFATISKMLHFGTFQHLHGHPRGRRYYKSVGSGARLLSLAWHCQNITITFSHVAVLKIWPKDYRHIQCHWSVFISLPSRVNRHIWEIKSYKVREKNNGPRWFFGTTQNIWLEEEIMNPSLMCRQCRAPESFLLPNSAIEQKSNVRRLIDLSTVSQASVSFCCCWIWIHFCLFFMKMFSWETWRIGKCWTIDFEGCRILLTLRLPSLT